MSMTIADLRKALESQPDDMTVMIRQDNADGYTDANVIRTMLKPDSKGSEIVLVIEQ